MRWFRISLLLVSCLSPLAYGQTFEASLEKQKAAVQQQVAAANQAASTAVPQSPSQDSFFTVAWPVPPDMAGGGYADCDPLPAKDLDPIVSASAATQKIKADLIRAVIQQESGAKPCAVSPKGAMGLMQLMPDTAQRLNVTDPFDPQESIPAGAALLKTLLDKYKGDTTLALSAYNAGEKSVDAAGGIPDIPETKNYVKSITGKTAAISGSPPQPSPR